MLKISPFPKDTEESQSWGFWVSSGFMKKQQFLQEIGDPTSWEKQVTSKATLMLCLKLILLQGNLCSATKEFWLHLVYGLWSQISKEYRLFLSGFERQTPSSPSSSQHTKWEKIYQHYICYFFSFHQLSSSTWLPGVTAVLFLRLSSNLFMYSTERPPFLNGDCVCQQTPENRTLNYRLIVLQVDSIWSVDYVIWGQQHRG